MKIRTFFVGAAIALATSAAALSAQAQELVVNGGFETGNLSGWTQSGNTGHTGVDSGASSGSYGAYFGPVGSIGSISQDIVTQAGQNYVFSFDLLNDGGATNSFEALFNGVSLISLADAGQMDWSHFSYNVSALGDLSNITFNFRQDPAYYHLDNVSVQAAVGNAVPEPATWATMILGFGVVGAMMRRRRQAVLA